MGGGSIIERINNNIVSNRRFMEYVHNSRDNASGNVLVGRLGKHNIVGIYHPTAKVEATRNEVTGGTGSIAAQQMQEAYAPPMNPSPVEVATTPSFEEQKARLMLRTEQAVQPAVGMPPIVSEGNRLVNRANLIDIYNRGRFPSLRNITKTRRNSIG